jgi:rod shape-determining protein MreB
LDGICDIIEHTPPELVGDILHNGMVLMGGGSKLGGLDKLIQKVTGIKTTVASNPESCVAKGLGVKLDMLGKWPFDDGNK